MRFVLVVLLATLTCAGAVAKAADKPLPECGDAADKALFRVTSWRGLALYWEHFDGCNDGYFGEHISELVSTWLAQRPTTLFKLSLAAQRHPSLMPLVVRHINTIASQADLRRIRANADQRCPGGAEIVCAAIVARVDELEGDVRRKSATGNGRTRS